MDLIKEKDADGKFTSETTKVYAKPLRWDLNTTVDKSFLVKNLDISNVPASVTNLNDYSNKRSYWATSTKDVSYDKSFAWHGIQNKFSSETYAYCHENTTGTNTKIIVAAQLVDSNGSAVTIAQWLVNYYAFDNTTPEGATTPNGWTNTLLAAVANSLDLYKRTGAEGSYTYTKISPTDIMVKPGYGYNDKKSDASEYYKVYFELTDGAKINSWVKGNGSETVLENANAEVMKVPAAKVWQNGSTYYFADIEQFTNVPGVVRNHYYNIQITDIKGLGTPVYYPDSYTPENPTPEIPEIPEPVVPNDQETYLSAKINVLSWKVVDNSIELGK